MAKPKITDTRTIEVEIGGTVHKMTLPELQALYDEIAKVDGIKKSVVPFPYRDHYERPWTIPTPPTVPYFPYPNTTLPKITYGQVSGITTDRGPILINKACSR